jgi:hypothetical protein
VKCSIQAFAHLIWRATPIIGVSGLDCRIATALWRVLRLGFLVFACCTACAAQLTFHLPVRPAILQRGSGTTDFVIENKGDKAPLALYPGVPIDETSHVALAGAKVNLRLEPGTQPVPQKIDPHTMLDIGADIADLTASVAAQIPIFNGNVRLGEIEAVASDVPLNLSIDGAGRSGTPLLFTYGRKVSISLKNGDPITYPIEWSFQVRGMSESDKLILPAKGTATIVLAPQRSVYSVSDRVHPSSQTAELLLSPDVPALHAIQPQTARALPVQLTMQRMATDSTTIWSDIYVVIFLLIGGGLSVLASSVLPNMLRKAALREQINDLADRTSSVSTRVDSYLRVLLRVERMKMDAVLRSTKYYSLTASESLDDVSSDIGRLTKRLAVAERLDDLRSKWEAVSATAPPSIIGEVDATLQAAADQMHSLALPEDNVTAANKILDDAAASLMSINDASAMAKQIAENFADLKTRVNSFPFDYSDLRAALPGVFKILEGSFEDPGKITSAMGYAIDHDIAAIHTALDYVVVRESVPRAESSNSAAGRTGIKSGPKDHERELTELLGTMSWQALRDARTLVREMREGIYEKDVLDEIGRPDQAEVIPDPRKPHPDLPVNLCIRFRDPRFNSAAAIDRLSCKWEFPSHLNEQGWKVCHYFLGTEPVVGQSSELQSPPSAQPDEGRSAAPPPAEKKPKILSERDINIKVTVQSQEGAEDAPRELPCTIEMQPRRRPDYSRSAAEGLRFLIAFGVALAGLLSGAVAQLQKLDLVPATLAIVGLGFGADTVKNLLTQPPKAVTPSKSRS